MREYEIVVLYHPDLEMNLDPVLEKVKKLIEANGGKIVKIDAEGKKRMAYIIKGQEFALYYYYTVEMPAEGPNKLSGVLNITDEVLRAQVIKEDGEREKWENYLKEKAEKEAAAEEKEGANNKEEE